MQDRETDPQSNGDAQSEVTAQDCPSPQGPHTPPQSTPPSPGPKIPSLQAPQARLSSTTHASTSSREVGAGHLTPLPDGNIRMRRKRVR
jgi:hypothetical protein